MNAVHFTVTLTVEHVSALPRQLCNPVFKHFNQIIVVRPFATTNKTAPNTSWTC
jgi:hypothetical protein